MLCITIAVALTGCSVVVPPDPDAPLVLLARSGSTQWAPSTAALASPIAIAVGRNGAPEAGALVRFTTTDGSIAPASVTTGPNGVAGAAWTLPAGAVPRAVRATATVENGPTVRFTAFVVPAANAVVVVVNNAYAPVPRAVNAGQTVTWLWYDDALGHSVTPVGLEPPGTTRLEDGPFVYSHTFPASGNYTFYCTAHGGPTGTGMAGVIAVGAP
jgi:plastocyanin